MTISPRTNISGPRRPSRTHTRILHTRERIELDVVHKITRARRKLQVYEGKDTEAPEVVVSRFEPGALLRRQY